MELKNYIEKAEKKAEKQKELAKILGISAGYIRMVKGGKRGLPEAICMKLADYIDEDKLSVIAASGLVTEKDPERRKILESCFRKVATVAGVAIITSIMTLSTGSNVKANPTQSVYNNINYQQYRRRKFNHKRIDYVVSILNDLINVFQHRQQLSLN